MVAAWMPQGQATGRNHGTHNGNDQKDYIETNNSDTDVTLYIHEDDGPQEQKPPQLPLSDAEMIITSDPIEETLISPNILCPDASTFMDRDYLDDIIFDQ